MRPATRQGHGAHRPAEAVGALMLTSAKPRRSPRPPLAVPVAERGVTVVEMLVASMILAVGVAAVATLFVASARSAGAARGHDDAGDLAASEVEIIRSMPYAEVGIAVSADGYAPFVDGRPTVTEPDDNRIEPIGTASRDGVDFTIERSATWAPIGAERNGYKIVVVTVTWSSSAGERSVTVQTGRFEGDRS